MLQTADQMHRLTWGLRNEVADAYDISLEVINIGVDQTINTAASSAAALLTSSTASSSAVVATTLAPVTATTPTPSASSTSSTTALFVAAPRNVLSRRADINKTIIANQPATVAYTWLVNVPQGDYYILGSVNDPSGTMGHSGLFTVMDTGNSSCLNSTSQSASQSQAPSHTSTTAKHTSSSAASSQGADTTTTTSSKGGISTGAIAGIAVGGAAVILILLGLLFWYRRRRNSRRATEFYEKNGPEMGQRPQGSHDYGTYATASGGVPLTPLEMSRGSSTGGSTKDRHTSSDSVVPTPALLSNNGRDAVVGSRENGNGNPYSPGESSGDPFSTAPSTPGMDALASGADQSQHGYTAAGPSDVYTPEDQEGITNNRRASQPPGQQLPTNITLAMTRARSMSQPSNGKSGAKVSPSKIPEDSPGIGRTGSKRRKPVPSLGAELRGQMNKEDASRSTDTPPLPSSSNRPMFSKTGSGDSQTSYQIMPDRPLNLED